ncbi:MAG: molecular chaperone DnaJ [Candidatus Omnitrophota bacterium]
MKRDYYEILGAAKDADISEIKKKYRSLALKYHPDRVAEDKKKESEEKFKEISEAYGVLSDPQKRQMYDQHGHQGIDQRYTAEDIFKGANFEDFGFGDIFSRIFGDSAFDVFGGAFGEGRGSRHQRGHDIKYEVDITLEEAYAGVAKKIKIPRHDQCPGCQGTGAKTNSAIKTCPVCKGQGQTMISSGFFRMSQTCSSCGGQGKVISEFCPQCQGKGVIRSMRSIDVSIPAGVDNNSRLRVKGEGEIGSGGRGDLYLYIYVKEHSTFERAGKDLRMELPISFVKAALGGEVSVPTLDGPITMRIPAGTQSGKIFRIRDKGMTDLHSGSKGNQYVQVMLQVPTQLTQEQKRLLEEYARVSGEDIKDSPESIKEKIKKVFK